MASAILRCDQLFSECANYESTGDWPNAGRQMALYCSECNPTPADILRLAEFQVRQRMYKSAAGTMSRLNPQDLGEYGTALRCHIHCGFGKLKLAKEELLKLNQEGVYYNQMLPIIEIASGRIAEARALYEKGMGQGDGGVFPDALINYADLITIEGSAERAKMIYADALQKEFRVEIAVNAAVNAAACNDHATAEAYIDSAESITPGHSMLDYARARLSVAKKDYASAKGYYKKILEINPLNVAALSEGASVLCELKEYEAALASARAALEESPLNVLSNMVTNQALWKAGNKFSAVVHGLRSASHSPPYASRFVPLW